MLQNSLFYTNSQAYVSFLNKNAILYCIKKYDTVRGTVFAPLNAYLIRFYIHISSEMTDLTRMHHFQNRIHFSGTLFHSDFNNHSPGLQNIDSCNILADFQN